MPVGIFYYPWYSSNPASSPENWNSKYTSLLGKYDGGSQTVIRQHIAWLDYTGVDFAIASWWGPGTKEDTRFPLLLSNTAAVGSDLKWCPYYEDEGFSDPTSATIRADLDYIIAQGYTAHANYLKWNGKPVIFVYGDALDADAMATRWAPINDFYVVLKVFPGFETTTDQPDSWHQYGPAVGRSQHPPYSNNVSPGFWFWSDASPQLARDITRFKADLVAMKASGVLWQLITSFNEYGEGTVIEPSTGTGVGTSSWPASTSYLDAVHDVFGATTTDVVVCHMGDGSTQAVGARCRTIASRIPDCDVFVYGGDVYNAGTATEFTGANGFDAAYGDTAAAQTPPGQFLLPKMAHTLGNHEYGSGDPTTFRVTSGADAYYLGGTPARVTRSYVRVDTTHTDAAATYTASGLSSADAQKVAVAQWSHLNYLDVSGWRLLFLDTGRYNTNDGAFPTAGAYRAAVQTLVDGAAYRRLIVFGHHPKWTSSLSHSEPRPEMTPLWEMIAPKALLYISGHDHVYERQNARLVSGAVASQQQHGCAQIICGTAGTGLNSFAASYAPAEALGFQNETQFGFVQLTLRTNTVDLQYSGLGSDGLAAPTVIDTQTFKVAPEPQTFTISNSASGTAMSWAITSSATWLAASPTTGSTPATVTVSVDPTGLAAGTYTANLTVAATGATNTPVTVPVTLTVTAAGGGSTPPPSDGGGGTVTPPPSTPPVSGPVVQFPGSTSPTGEPILNPMSNLLLAFCEALMAPIAPMEQVVRGSDDYGPWERAVDVEGAPLWVLPWLACIVGIEWRGAPTEDLRSLIRDRPRFRRGMNASIRAAAASTLTGERSVDLIPRVNGNPNLLTVLTVPSETPDPVATERAIRSEIPVWVRLITGQEDTPIIDVAGATVTIDAAAAGVTINNVTAVDVA